MTTFYRTTLTAIGPDVADLLEGGILILFAEGAPPELAEVSALHRVQEGPTPEPPPVGAVLRIGALEARLTAIGALAWNKVAEIGHVVINFDGAIETGRSGEMSAEATTPGSLAAAVTTGPPLLIER